MPGKYVLKEYVEGGTYHLFNRGVEKRKIFLDDQDYKVFLNLLKTYLMPVEKLQGTLSASELKFVLNKKNFSDQIELLCYCLMPNHFHLMVRQRNKNDITNFMRALVTNYSMYFNNKYERVGSLFQGVFKGIRVENDEYLLYLSKYIHQNPKELTENVLNYEYSSIGDYIGGRKTEWVNPGFILGAYGKNKAEQYKIFVKDTTQESEEVIKGLIID